MEAVRDSVSKGEPNALFQNELNYLDEAERHELLKQAGIVCTVSTGQALAIKAELGIPWEKLRKLRKWVTKGKFGSIISLTCTSNRYLKASGVSIACEEKMRQIAREIIGDNLKGEVSPFSFPLKSGGEEIRGAPHIFMPNLNNKIIQLLEQNHR